MDVEDDYGRLLLGSVVVGVLGAAGTLVFLVAEHALHAALWSDDDLPTGFFEGPWQVVPVVLIAFALIGVMRWRWRLTGPDPNFVDEMVHGEAPLGHSLKLVSVSLVTLVGGGSVGPEAPVASLGAGIGHEVGRRMPLTEAHRRDLTFAGIAGVFGPIASFPFAAPIVALEADAGDRFGSYGRLLPGLVASTVGLALLYPVIGTPFLRVYDIGGQQPLQVWWVVAAAALGVVGGLCGLVVTAAIGFIGRVGAAISHPVVRAVASGVIIAVVAVAAPLTMFSGRNELGPVLGAGVVATSVIVGSLLLKVLVLGLALRWGGFGGAIFPLFFIGSALGVVLHRAVDALPLVVTGTAMAGAVTVAVVPLPLMVLILVIFLYGVRVETSAVPSTAILSAFLVVHVTGWRARLLASSAR